MRLKIKKLDPQAVIPKKAYESDIGFDLVAISKVIVDNKDHGYIEYSFGLAVQPEQGYYCEIVPRSSISNTGLWLANSQGVIDPDYTGELKARFKWIPNTKTYEIGDRVAQLIVRPKITVDIEEVQELEVTKRGAGGYGSTGK